jgi:hypothetical protein
MASEHEQPLLPRIGQIHSRQGGRTRGQPEGSASNKQVVSPTCAAWGVKLGLILEVPVTHLVVQT